MPSIVASSIRHYASRRHFDDVEENVPICAEGTSTTWQTIREAVTSPTWQQRGAVHNRR